MMGKMVWQMSVLLMWGRRGQRVMARDGLQIQNSDTASRGFISNFTYANTTLISIANSTARSDRSVRVASHIDRLPTSHPAHRRKTQDRIEEHKGIQGEAGLKAQARGASATYCVCDYTKSRILDGSGRIATSLESSATKGAFRVRAALQKEAKEPE